MTSDTSLRSWARAASCSIRRPSSPRPWKLYGELRGLNAPPRSTFAPARFTAAAVACTCCSFSAEHGPAMTMTSSPPMRRSSEPDDGALRPERAAGELEGLRDVDDFLHAVVRRDQLGIPVHVGPDHAEHRTVGAGGPVDREAHALEARHDLLHVGRRRALLHHHNHVGSSFRPSRRHAARRVVHPPALRFLNGPVFQPTSAPRSPATPGRVLCRTTTRRIASPAAPARPSRRPTR